MRAAALVAVLVCGGCLHDQLVQCDDGTLCPRGTHCDPVHATCVTADQATACNTLVDGDPCIAGATPGICDLGVCVPGCGDGIQNPGEECDDGNFLSHDGCSSACKLEFASWSEWETPWHGRGGAVAGYFPTTSTLVFATGSESVGEFDDQWSRQGLDRTWTHATAGLGRRTNAASAFDSARNRLVVFGGEHDYTQLGDTWEYDGTQWHQLAPSTSPPARASAAMVYDASRQKSVLFGGRNSLTVLNDTWEWDGTVWVQQTPATSPSPRAGASLAWDAPNSRAILFGGSSFGNLSMDTWQYKAGAWLDLALNTTHPSKRALAAFAPSPTSKLILVGGQLDQGNAASDVWQFDAGAWSSLPAALIPPGRIAASAVLDTNLGAMVLAGGVSFNGTGRDDVWEYDGAQWKDTSLRLAPSPRLTRIAYDAARGQIVLYSGLLGNGQSVPDDTWLFDDTANWQKTSATTTNTRWAAGLAYSSALQKVVLFGGAFQLTLQNETWTWDGSSWSNLGILGPPARAFPGMAENAHDGTVVMFGGIGENVEYLADTWELDTAQLTWSLRPTPPDLAETQRPVLAYDALGGRVLLVDDSGMTWAFANHTWQKVGAQAPARLFAALAYDPWRRRVVRYGGTTGPTVEGDLWELKDDTWSQIPLYGAQPPVRSQPALAPMPALRAMVVYGGLGYGDTWILKFVSTTPDEVCSNGIDDDGDRHVDAGDPDCPG